MPGPLRRHLRIGLGGLMLAILVLGLWLGYRVNKAREQLHALAAVKAAGGWVRYADEFVMGGQRRPGQRHVEAGLGHTHTEQGARRARAAAALDRRRVFPRDRPRQHFRGHPKGSATAPGLNHPPLNEMLRSLESQKGIRTLQLGGDTVTEEGLASIAGLTELRELFIWWASGVTDAGIARIGRLPRLQQVNISLSALTDEGVGHLADLPALEVLSLQGKAFTNASLVHLGRQSAEAAGPAGGPDGNYRRGAGSSGRTQGPHAARPGRGEAH